MLAEYKLFGLVTVPKFSPTREILVELAFNLEGASVLLLRYHVCLLYVHLSVPGLWSLQVLLHPLIQARPRRW